MALKTFKPYTKSTRGTILVDRTGLWKGKPFKKLEITNSLVILDKPSKDFIEKSIRNIPNIKITDVNHFSSFDLVKFKKIVFTESSVKELEKRYS